MQTFPLFLSLSISRKHTKNTLSKHEYQYDIFLIDNKIPQKVTPFEDTQKYAQN